MIKLDIINEVVNRTGITKTKAEMAVETVFESMKRSLAKGDRIELRGFGVFNVRPRKTGIGRNPRTGAEVSIPPGKAVHEANAPWTSGVGARHVVPLEQRSAGRAQHLLGQLEDRRWPVLGEQPPMSE